MQRMYYKIVNAIIATLIFMVAISINLKASSIKPVAKNGVLNLSKYDLANNQNVSLKGEWKFVLGKFIEPENANNCNDWSLVEVPKNLKNQKYANKEIAAHGYGTYFLKIIFNPNNKGIKLRFKTAGIPSASKIFVNNELIGFNGTIADSKEKYQPDLKINFNEFSILSDTLQIIIQVSNYHINKFGLFYNIEMGLVENIQHAIVFSISKDFFIFGSIFLMLLYHLVLFFLRRKDNSNLYFAIACFAFAYYTFGISDTFFQSFPNVNFEFALRFKRISLIIALISISIYFYHVLKSDFSKIALKIISFVCVFYTLGNVLLPLSISDKLIVSFRYIGLLISIYVLFVVVKAIIKKREGALLYGIGLFVMLLAIINDFLYNSQVINSTDLMPLSMLFFLFLQSYQLAVKFNKAFRMTENLSEELTYINKNLEKIVDERTKEIYQQKKLIEEKNEILNQTNEEIAAQRDLLVQQKNELEKLSIVASETDNAVMIMDEKGNFEWVNPAFEKIYKMKFVEFKQKYGSNIFSTSKQADIIDKIKYCFEHKTSVSYNSFYDLSNDEKLWFQTTLTPILGRNDEVYKLVSIETNICELKKTQEELQQQKEELQQTIEYLNDTQKQLVESEKMASLGGLVAGVAHEINTPVGIGITASSTLTEKTNEIIESFKTGKMKKSDLDSYFETALGTSNLILTNLVRTGDLIQSFKQVSVDQVTEQQREFYFKNYLEDIVRSLNPKIKRTKLSVEIICPDDVLLNSYPGPYAQIITNLIVNSTIHAFDAETEGLLKLEAKSDGKNLIFIYSDNGKGMTKEVLKKVFDPFFTTNKQVGTGLGMHILYNLVTQKLKGNVDVWSELGKGVRFTITAPLNLTEN